MVRRGTRYSVFARTFGSELTRRMGPSDAVVEVWNGVPWFTPVWYRRPKIVMLHHVHGPMWDQLFPGPIAAAGRLLEARLAPPFYRRTLTVTPSDATREELLELGFRPDRVVAVPNGVDPFFRPDGRRTAHPSLVAVGRLAPVKRFELVIDAAVEARRRVPGLTMTIVGEGPLKPELQARIDAAGASDWITLTGHVAREQLVGYYQSAWLVVSGSLAEGLAIVRGSRLLAGSLIAAAVSMLGLGAVNVLFVPLIVNDLQVDPAWMAGIEFAQTAAMIMAAGVVALLVRRFAPTTIITAGLAGIGVCIGLMSGVTAVWQVLALLFVVGWMVTPLQAMLQTIVQTASTDATRGRVVSILQASLSTASVVSMAIGGVLGDLIGIRAVYLAAAGLVVIAAGVSFVLFRGVPARPSVAPISDAEAA